MRGRAYEQYIEICYCDIQFMVKLPRFTRSSATRCGQHDAGFFRKIIIVKEVLLSDYQSVTLHDRYDGAKLPSQSNQQGINRST